MPNASEPVMHAQELIRLNADLRVGAFMPAEGAIWLPSPQPGVECRLLERDGGEVARATSIVRYAADSRFPVHRHDLGEEFLVLDGVFSDARGNYGAGTYVRNPPGSKHAPWSDPGCTIFVKLRQMSMGETERLCVDSRTADWAATDFGARLPLFANRDEDVALYLLDAGANLHLAFRGRAELLVVEGHGSDRKRRIVKGDWMRLPGNGAIALTASDRMTVFAKCYE